MLWHQQAGKMSHEIVLGMEARRNYDREAADALFSIQEYLPLEGASQLSEICFEYKMVDKGSAELSWKLVKCPQSRLWTVQDILFEAT